MRSFIVLAAVALLALPMTSFGWTIELDVVESGTGASEITIDCSLGNPQLVSVDVLLTSDYEVAIVPPEPPFTKGLDGVQYQLEANGSALDSCVDFITDGTAWVNGTVFTGAEYSGKIAGYAPYPPFNNLATINAAGAELYFKGAGAYVYPVTDGLVATYTFYVDCECVDCDGQIVIDAISDDYGHGNNPAPVADIGHGYTGGSALIINCVPEPATALLLLGAIPFLRRRR
jgi:MYXO-CTERM domain-containing protein